MSDNYKIDDVIKTHNQFNNSVENAITYSSCVIMFRDSNTLLNTLNKVKVFFTLCFYNFK